jgi:hypothetical protein
VLSPWQKSLALQNNQAFITMMGFNCKSFDKVLEEFSPMFSGHTRFDWAKDISPGVLKFKDSGGLW